MYIVTGGVGFIGTCVVQELNRRGIEDIIIVDRLDESVKWKNLREIKFNEYINADEFIEIIGTNEFLLKNRGSYSSRSLFLYDRDGYGVFDG